MKKLVSCAIAACTLVIASVPALANGSLAIDKSHPHSYGWAVDKESYRESDRVALANCPGDCQVVYQFSHTCAAFASQEKPNGATGWAHRDTADEAKEEAVRECERYADHCAVRVWGCDR